ncbi:U-box domain-containing protein 5-like [Iris pallida]|uniref:RING-type E3 ubiquitin transferase n=1 Tax=Iris pallida TaxID=29817 RepID=A0AAX6E7E8_IRIPA|nr:U-box domain-containing protein 5-like [Iris pallida]
MGSDVAEVVHVPQNSVCVKVHSSICVELAKVLDKVKCILPAIESARPGCRSGIQELCSLSNTLEKLKLLIQYCTECSKLYLALTGESIVLRCERIRASLNQSLWDLHSMVPQVVAIQISGVLDYLRDVRFVLESNEEEAGKAMLELLGQADSSEELELKAFEVAVVNLNILSPKSILVERRSIKKLLDKIHGTDSKKEKILNYFLYLMSKYGKKVKADVVGVKVDFRSVDKCLISSDSPKTVDPEDNDKPSSRGEAQTDSSTSDVTPEEFCCPISSRLMYDPVVIASGQTFERLSIEKWFNEGHDICPKTQKKLENLFMIPNLCMKDLILNWCRKHGINLEDPSAPSQSWEPSHYSSISSLKNVPAILLDGRSGDYMVQSDHSNVSFVSSNSSYCSDSSHVKGIDSLKGRSDVPLFPWSDEYLNCHSFSDFSHDMYLKFFNGLCELQLVLQYKAVEDLKLILEGDEGICYAMLSNGFADALMIFLRNAYSISDVHAQRTGALIFLAFLDNLRVDIPLLTEDAYQLLIALLESEVALEALMILQKLSRHPNFKDIIAISSLPQSITKFLDFEDKKVLELVIKILCDLSLHVEVRSHIISSGCIQKLATLLGDKRLAESCLKVLHNLSDIKEAAALIADSDGCISLIAELLECGSREEQGYGVAIFHSLCSCSLDYCLLVLKEGVIPSLVDISVNGNAKGKENSMKLLHLLREMRLGGSFDVSEPPCDLVPEIVVEDPVDHSTKKQPRPKSSGFFGRKMRVFSKWRNVALS